MHGEAGIGKTTLLEALVERSGGTVTVVRACGAETEAELAFSALADLPGTGARRAGGAALALQAAALRGGARARSFDCGTRRHPVTGSLSASPRSACCGPPRDASRCSPWRRISSGSTRPPASVSSTPPAGPAGRSPSCWRHGSELPAGARRPAELRVGPVDEAGAAALLRHRAPGSRPPSPRRSRRPPRATRWPWWTARDPHRRSARGTAAIVLPLAPAPAQRQQFWGRVGALDAPARLALLIAAAYAGPGLAVIAAACQLAGTDVTHLGDAEASAWCGIKGRPGWTSPIPSSAAWCTPKRGGRTSRRPRRPRRDARI